jgi:hypothetical protein
VGVCGASWDDGGTLWGVGHDSVAQWERVESDASSEAEESERMGVIRHDWECLGVVFGPVWGVSDWECDRPDGPGFGLPPSEPRGRLVRRRLGRALGQSELGRPGWPAQQPRFPPRSQFTSVSSKQSGRQRSGCGAGVGSEWSERKTARRLWYKSQAWCPHSSPL